MVKELETRVRPPGIPSPRIAAKMANTNKWRRRQDNKYPDLEPNIKIPTFTAEHLFVDLRILDLLPST